MSETGIDSVTPGEKGAVQKLQKLIKKYKRIRDRLGPNDRLSDGATTYEIMNIKIKGLEQDLQAELRRGTIL